MDVVVWSVAVILVANVAFVTLCAIVELRFRHRARREVDELNAIWHASSARVDERTPSPLRLAIRTRPIATSPTSAARRRVSGLRRRVVVAAGAAAVLAAAILVVAAPVGSEWLGSRSEALVRGLQAGAPDRTGGSGADDAGVGAVPGSDQAVSEASAPVSDDRNRDVPAPDRFEATPTSATSIELAWADVPDALEYQIERRSGGEGVEEWALVGTTDGPDTTFVDTPLEPATTYFYRVAAVTDGGVAPPSDVVSVTTPVEPPASTTLSATATSTGVIELVWEDVAGETGYRVERSIAGAGEWATIATTVADVIGYADGGPAPGTTYEYRVFAVNDGGESVSSNVASATTESPGAGGGASGDGSASTGDGASGDGSASTGDGASSTGDGESGSGDGATAENDAAVDDETGDPSPPPEA